MEILENGVRGQNQGIQALVRARRVYPSAGNAATGWCRLLSHMAGKSLIKTMPRPEVLKTGREVLLGLALVLLDHDGRHAKGPGPHRENLRAGLAAFAQFRHLKARLLQPGPRGRDVRNTP